jgi:hypothetical protein
VVETRLIVVVEMELMVLAVWFGGYTTDLLNTSAGETTGAAGMSATELLGSAACEYMLLLFCWCYTGHRLEWFAVNTVSHGDGRYELGAHREDDAAGKSAVKDVNKRISNTAGLF